MAILCLLERGTLLRYLLGLLTPGCAALSAGGTGVIETLPNGQLATDPPGPLLFMPSSSKHSSSPHQPPLAWASGHLASTRSCYCKSCHGNTTQSILLSAHSDSSTGSRNDIGSVTVQQKDKTRIHRAHVTSATSGTRGSLPSRVPLPSLPCNKS